MCHQRVTPALDLLNPAYMPWKVFHCILLIIINIFKRYTFAWLVHKHLRRAAPRACQMLKSPSKRAREMISSIKDTKLQDDSKRHCGQVLYRRRALWPSILWHLSDIITRVASIACLYNILAIVLLNYYLYTLFIDCTVCSGVERWKILLE